MDEGPNRTSLPRTTKTCVTILLQQRPHISSIKQPHSKWRTYHTIHVAMVLLRTDPWSNGRPAPLPKGLVTDSTRNADLLVTIQRLRQRPQQGPRVPAQLPGCLPGAPAHLENRESPHPYSYPRWARSSKERTEVEAGIKDRNILADWTFSSSQHPRSTILYVPFVTIMWATTAGKLPSSTPKSVAFETKSDITDAPDSFDVRHGPQGCWLQHLVRQGLSSVERQRVVHYRRMIEHDSRTEHHRKAVIDTRGPCYDFPFHYDQSKLKVASLSLPAKCPSAILGKADRHLRHNCRMPFVVRAQNHGRLNYKQCKPHSVSVLLTSQGRQPSTLPSREAQIRLPWESSWMRRALPFIVMYPGECSIWTGWPLR